MATESGDTEGGGESPEAPVDNGKAVAAKGSGDADGGGETPEANKPTLELAARLEDLLRIGRALGLSLVASRRMHQDFEKSPESTYNKVLRYIETKAADLRSQHDKATHRRTETREGIENIIRTSSDWGYDMARSGAPKTVPDVVWNSDDTWRIVTKVPVGATIPIAETGHGSTGRHIKALEDEIKNLEKAKHGPFGKASLDALSGNASWLLELKKRLRSIDPGNPWARP